MPEIKFKTNNYLYQVVYVSYILSFLAYIYVRINYTLDAPGLNRIYCIVVACLEIITAPSLVMQVCGVLQNIQYYFFKLKKVKKCLKQARSCSKLSCLIKFHCNG